MKNITTEKPEKSKENPNRSVLVLSIKGEYMYYDFKEDTFRNVLGEKINNKTWKPMKN